MAQQLYPDAAQRIMKIVQSVFGPAGEVFKDYFLGTPDNLDPAQDLFPFVIVDKVGGTYKVGPLQADDITEHVYIHIVADLKTGFNAPPQDNVVKRQLQTYVEGRDPTTGYLLTTSLLYGLRTNLTLNSPVAPG